MWPKQLLLFGLLWIGQMTLLGQSDVIPCELTNLYQLTVSKSPTIQRQNIQSRRARADKQSAVGAFDYQLYGDLSANRSSINLFNADPRKAIVNQIKANNLSLSAGVQRTFRTGLTASAGLDYTRAADNYTFNVYNESVEPFTSDNITNTNLTVTQPLLRGRGRNITTANEKVADINIEGQMLNASFVTSNEVFSMVLGYWQYLNANKSLEIYKDNEARVRKVLEVTDELIKGEKKPASDLLQIQADLKNKEQQTILAAQQLYNAKQNLGRLVGLNKAESEKLGLPANDFPKIEEVHTTISIQDLLEMAHNNRADLKALKKSLEAFAVYVNVAENNTKPQLDLTAFIGYGGSDTGSIDRLLTALGRPG